jgi:hypothetical protein
MSAWQLWAFFPLGYLATVAVESPLLLVGLSARHSWRRKVFAGLWLTGCTYPIVVLVLPLLMADASRCAYLLVAETFAPLAECGLFWLAFGRAGRPENDNPLRDFTAIVLANLASFGLGELVYLAGWGIPS